MIEFFVKDTYASTGITLGSAFTGNMAPLNVMAFLKSPLTLDLGGPPSCGRACTTQRFDQLSTARF